MSELGFLEDAAAAVEQTLERLLPAVNQEPAQLAEAMRYSCLAGGKRIRPALVLMGGELFGLEAVALLEPAAAMEIVHCFSLIHDDLPALDDDDLRRGRPTAHKAFDEATAILAGDALLNFAFEIFGRYPESADPQTRLDCVLRASRAIGFDGMIGGQMADLEAERVSSDAQSSSDDLAVRLESIHRRKTGALLETSLWIGGRCAGADASALRTLERLGAAIGLLFQIRDDILDVEGSAAQLGKTPGKDEQVGKLTYPALFGLDGARSRLAAAEHSASAQLQALPAGTARQNLESLVEFLASRDH